MPIVEKPKFVKPEVKRVFGEIVGSNSETKRYVSGDKEFFVRSKVRKKELQILAHLLSKGIAVEESFSSKAIGRKRLMAYIGKGRNLVESDFYRVHNTKQKLATYYQVVDILGAMHSENVSHNHPHCENFVMDNNGRVTLVDFKKANFVKPDWNDAEDIFNRFKKDYLFLNGIFNDFELNDRYRKAFIMRMISKYKYLGPNTKRQLFDLINSRIIDRDVWVSSLNGGNNLEFIDWSNN